ncbi:hypothetical protein LTR53_001848 [Teratosphaeriaceae sp. CCFEE 6253]|nr:hypothetical protein LTR53_001848 [Teratosphaeriaceae sp. CCFEE 6253]
MDPGLSSDAPPATFTLSTLQAASIAPTPLTQLQAVMRNPDPNRFAAQMPPPYTPNPPPQWQGIINSGSISTHIYATQLAGTPLSNAQPPIGPFGTQISVPEIMTYHPNWVLLPPVAMRLTRNGYRPEDLASMLLRARGTFTLAERETAVTRIKKQLSEAGKLYLAQVSGTRIRSNQIQQDLGPQNDLTALTWETRGAYPGGKQSTEFVHAKLSSFYSHLPQGANSLLTGSEALMFTKCLHFAAANPHLDLDTSHFSWIQYMLASEPSQQHNVLHAPASPVAGNRYDAAVLKKRRKRSH